MNPTPDFIQEGPLSVVVRDSVEPIEVDVAPKLRFQGCHDLIDEAKRKYIHVTHHKPDAVDVNAPGFNANRQEVRCQIPFHPSGLLSDGPDEVFSTRIGIHVESRYCCQRKWTLQRIFGTWEALVGIPTGIEHAFAILEDVAAERAIEEAMRRAESKYGAQDWSRWRFRAEWVSYPVELRMVHFTWSNGLLVRPR